MKITETFSWGTFFWDTLYIESQFLIFRALETVWHLIVMKTKYIENAKWFEMCLSVIDESSYARNWIE